MTAERITVVWTAEYDGPGDFADTANQILQTLHAAAPAATDPGVVAVMGAAGQRLYDSAVNFDGVIASTEDAVHEDAPAQPVRGAHTQIKDDRPDEPLPDREVGPLDQADHYIGDTGPTAKDNEADPAAGQRAARRLIRGES